MFYGCTDKYHVLHCINIACEAISPSNKWDAAALVAGTFAVETGFGTVRDNYEAQGRGLSQFDRVRFDEVYARIQNDPKIKGILKNEFGITVIHFEQLDYSPLLSALMCRIGYFYVPKNLPDAKDIGGQAAFWKKHWNSDAGKGTPAKYIEAQVHIPKF